ncbi:MAG: dihydrodipicolinate synthase family protein [Chloroflexi bacterium]|nr:dihydrodipicolinate synthase family protein [Chloroflexota bacterium]
MARAQDIRGMFLPPPTVFDGRGEVDEDMMGQLTDWYVESGVHGFFVLGSFGLGSACRIDQRKLVADLVVHRTRGRIPVVIQVGAVDPYTSVELGQHAKQVGADGIALTGPYYYSDRTEYELVEHYKMVDSAVRMPMLIYNNPAYQGYSLTPALLAKIVQAVPNIWGLKQAKGTIRDALPYMGALPDGFAIFIPILNMLPGLLVGVRGTISPPMAAAPEVGVEWIRAIDAGDYKTAVQIHVRIVEFSDRLEKLSRTYGHATLAHGIRLRGFAIKQYPRWPSKPMSPTDEEVLREALHKLVGKVPLRV